MQAHNSIVFYLMEKFLGTFYNYYAKVIIIESQNKSFAAIIIEFITTERSEVK